MKIKSMFTVSLLIAAIPLIVGCGNKDYTIVPVTGKVTAGGQPVAGLRVVFSPQSTADNNNPGPWSTGLTDEQGQYSLKTRYGDTGGVVGTNAVTFEYDDMETGAMDALKMELEKARSDQGSQEAFDDVKRRIAELKEKKKGRLRFSEEFSIMFDVPQGGSKAADFDVSDNMN